MWMVWASPGVFDGAVGSVLGGVEWQWRQAGSEAWWMVLALVLRVVAWCREPVRRSSLSRSMDARKSKRAEAAGSKVVGPCGSAN